MFANLVSSVKENKMTKNDNNRSVGNIKYILWIGTIGPAFLVIVIGFIALTQLYSSEDIGEQLDSEYEVTIAVREIEKLMVDLETGQRGFIITGQDAFLDPFETARSDIFNRIDDLKFRLEDRPLQINDLNYIEGQVSNWLIEAGDPEIEARRAFDRGEIAFEGVSSLLVAETGKRTVDSMRERLLSLLAEQKVLTNERKNEALNRRGSTEITIIGGVTLAILSTLLVGFFTSRLILSADWVKSKQAEILSNLQEAATLATFSEILLSTLIPVLSSQVASLYTIRRDSDRGIDNRLYRIGSYGGSTQDTQSKTFAEGESLIGQCFAAGKGIRIRDIPESYFDISTSLGTAKPKEVFLIPFKFENSVVAVLELASFSTLRKKELSLLDSLSESLGIMINNIIVGVRAEALLTEIKVSEERFRGIIDGSVDTIITIDPIGTVLSFNLAGEKLFGYRAEEVIGQNVKILMPNPYHDGHDGYLKNYHDSGEKKVIGIGRKVEAKKKDGTVFPMDLAVSEVVFEGHKIYSGIIRDITERQESEQDLRDSQAKIQAILDNTVDGLITIDDKGNIESYNKACESIFGYEKEEVIGQNVKMLMPEPYHSEHDDYLKNYHNTSVKKIIGSGRQVEGKRKNGHIFPLDLSVSEIDIEGRKLYSGIVRDITERQEADENLQQANEELEEFAYRTSHDLRSPLVSSIGLLNMTKKSIEADKKDVALETVVQVQKSLQQLEDLVKGILVLTQTKNVEEDALLIDVGSLLEISLEKFGSMTNFERLDVQKSLRFEGELRAKRSRFMLILENLISNAIKYQDTGKESSYIRISTYVAKGSFVLEVQDNGLGIPENQQAKLFTMFKRFHPRVSFGSGLGLYMMKKSANIMGAEIVFEDPGDGSTFKLLIPLSE